MNEPAILGSLITVLAAVGIALGSVFYRFGRLSGLISALRQEQTRRHTEIVQQGKERYDGIIRRLERLESHFISRASGDD